MVQWTGGDGNQSSVVIAGLETLLYNMNLYDVSYFIAYLICKRQAIRSGYNSMVVLYKPHL
jgi:hypothetical protein